tara:strand:- start:44 stop:325 length:282 start_codon:yes stop_codon:yes gene_type:complete
MNLLPPRPDTVATFRVQRRFHFADGTSEAEYFTTVRMLRNTAPTTEPPGRVWTDMNPDIVAISTRCTPQLTDANDPDAVARFKQANRWMAAHS